MAGRRPKPAAVKEMQGNPGRRKRAETVAAGEQPALLGAPPKELDAAARRVWAELAPQLARLKFVRETDRQPFIRYVTYLARWLRVSKQLAKEADTYDSVSVHGTLKRLNPLYHAESFLERRLVALEDRFGLSPQARQAILLRLAAAPQLTLPIDGDDNQTQDRNQADGPEEGPHAGGAIGFLADPRRLH